MSQTYWWRVNRTDTDSSSGMEFREVVHREINFDISPEGDGRTLYTRIVPYNTPHEVADPPDFVPYMEQWKPGVFDRQLKAANRVDVLLNFEHEKGIGGVVGRGVELRSETDGLHGTFRLLNGPDGEKARELVREEVLTGMSLEAVVMKSSRSSNGVVSRTEARLRNVALCRNPAFPGAEVLAVREQPEEPVSDDPVPDPPDPGDPVPDEPEGEPEPVSAVIVPELVARDDITAMLEKVGVTQLERRTVSRAVWDSDTDRFADDEYEASCLIDRGGDRPAKERCSLPILEPTGEVNILALYSAARRLPSTTGITNVQRAEVARHLVRVFRQVGETAPQAVIDAAKR
jgi:HK97 family phage prohead protease